MQEGGVMATRGCASLTPGYKPRLRLGLTCFACHRIHEHNNATASTVIMPQDGLTCFACHRIHNHVNAAETTMKMLPK